MRLRTLHRSAPVLAAVVLLAWSTIALAVGTPSGTTVSNTATLDYSVGGVGQTPITSNAADFLVDNRVDLTVSTLDATAVQVVPGALAQVLSYSVTNLGNTVQDYSLQALAATGTFFGVTDNFDATGVQVFVDGNSNGSYEPLVDTAGYIDELAADAVITVFIVADIPLGQADDDAALYDLWAQTATGGGGGSQGGDILSDDAATIDDPTIVQIVFGDGAGSADAAQDGAFSSRDAYHVVSATLDVAKTSTVVDDPFNGAVNPKAIPGATVRYSLTVSNTGTADAGNLALVDAMPTNTTYVPGTIVLDGSGLSDAADPDAGDFGVSNAGAVTVTIANLLAGGSATISFDVIID